MTFYSQKNPRAECPMDVEANIMALAFGEALFASRLARRQEVRLKSVSPIQGSRQDFKGFQYQIFLDSGPF